MTETPPWDKSWGQIAHEAYAEDCGGHGINGDRLPAWEGQDAAMQAHWSAAGLAVVRQYRLEEEEP
jgi:hypothetical protein